MIQQTTALRKIAALRRPIRVVQGGQGASKTFSILTLIINHAASKPNKEVLIVSAELTKMRLNVIKDFIKIMKSFDIYQEARMIGGTLYRFPNGSFVKFIGLDKNDLGKGTRCDVAFFNEANKIDRESYVQVASRAGIVYADFNPDAEFFLHTDVIPRPDCDFITLTFRDNEVLPERERSEIIRYKQLGYNELGEVINNYWANKWRVYGLGEIGAIDGVVFENWNEVEQVPATAKLVAYGLDFGYTNDPSACVGVYIFNNEYYLDEVMYSTGMLNDDIFTQLKPIVGSEVVYADAAEPKSIEELRRKGLNVLACVKGSDSVMYGINLLQEKKLNVTKKSINLKNELRYYTWMVDKNGAKMNKPIDNHNHAIDAIRYAVTSKEKFRANYI
jgi:phage terminase large subunit